MRKHNSRILLVPVFICLLTAGFYVYSQTSAVDTNVYGQEQVSLRTMRMTAGRAAQRQPFELQPGGQPERMDIPAGEGELETAILLVQDKDYAEAIPLLEAALERMPTVEAVWEALGWSYVGVERMQDADTLWRQYLALRPESPKAHSLLAQLAVLRSDWRAADEYFRRAYELDPLNYDIRYWYGQNLFRLGRLDQAVSLLEDLEQEDGMRYDVKTDLARIYTLLQRYEEAVDLWAEIVDVIPGNLDFRIEYARALMLVGALEDADEQARLILAEDASRQQAMLIRADVAELSGDAATMVQHLIELVEDTEDPEVQAQLRIRLAARYLVLHREDHDAWPLRLAVEQYAAAVDAVPDYVPWLNQYAGVALMDGQLDVARKLSTRVLEEFNRFNHLALRIRFELAMSMHDYDAAERALHEVYDLYQSDSPYRYFDLARIYVQRGRYFDALDALDRFEQAGHRGALLTLLYHGLTESEWMALTSTRRLQEHLMALQDAGFTFLAVSDIPAYLKSSRDRTGEEPLPTPWLARQVDQLRYAFTGRRRFQRLEDRRPEKVAVVTFDDGVRSSFRLGTPIAEDLQIPFWMAVITHLEELNAPVYAAWEEIQAYHETGAWEIGSHMMWANTDRPAGPEPSPPVATLPNRIWLPERNRLETLREWTRRVRREFEESRARIEEHLGFEPGLPMAVAYPYGDIGQSEGSNVSRILNPIRTILNEASREHAIGFVVDERVYTMFDDNPLLIRRYEPAWDVEADAVVEHVLMNHPVMMARRLRAEIATLSDRPYLAEQQIELLRRDGYPDRRLRELIDFTRNRAVAGQGEASLATPADTRRDWLRPSDVYLAAALRENQANEQILLRNKELRAGLNFNPRVGFELAWRDGTLDQTLTSNIWFAVQTTDFSSSTETRTETINGTSTVTRVDIQSAVTREVQTNRVERYRYAADVDEIRGTLSLRLSESTLVGFSLGEKRVNYREGRRRPVEEHREPIGSVLVTWRPYRALVLSAIYDHDLVPSALRPINYDAAGLGVFWKVRDAWELTCTTRYATYKDRNAMVNVAGSSFWELLERQGIWGGLEASVHTMDEDSELYWSPYWDTRYAAALRFHRAFPFYFFQFEVRLGRQREKARPEAVSEFRNLQAQARADGTWDPGTGPGADWDTFVGLRGTWRQRIWNHVDLLLQGNVNVLRDYSEHDVTAGVQVSF